MENIFENGPDWNLYENLKAFKRGEQNEFKTAANIRAIFENLEDSKRAVRLKNFQAEQESQQLKLERHE